jgi:hypothetical protein
MLNRSMQQMTEDFAQVAQSLAAPLAERFPEYIALAAKWEPRDLVPGLSDMDFRVICRDDMTVERWAALDRTIGEVHLQMVKDHPEWNRINEHTVGAAMTPGEVRDPRFHNSEYAVWTVWNGEKDWLQRVKSQLAERPFEAADEQQHLYKFLSYYSPYIHGIDPPINLAGAEAEYALHSRCWHYFAPPMFSAACLLARRNFSGKRAALQWLQANDYAGPQVPAVLEQVDAHYQTPELKDKSLFDRFERWLFESMQQIKPLLLDKVQEIQIDRGADVDVQKQALAAQSVNPLATLVENVRFARTRIGRYFFYLNAPPEFDVSEQFRAELVWAKKLSQQIPQSIAALSGVKTGSLQDCLENIGVAITPAESDAISYMKCAEGVPSNSPEARKFFSGAMEMFPAFYAVVERSLQTLNGRNST